MVGGPGSEAHKKDDTLIPGQVMAYLDNTYVFDSSVNKKDYELIVDYDNVSVHLFWTDNIAY